MNKAEKVITTVLAVIVMMFLFTVCNLLIAGAMYFLISIFNKIVAVIVFNTLMIAFFTGEFLCTIVAVIRNSKKGDK